jgi:hypothetical protein
MDAETIFDIANTTALAGWVVLVASPWMPVWSQRIAAFIVPGLLSVAYAGLIMAFWAGAVGGFSSLGEVALLFQTPELLLAGWLHFLAFDLFVGAWIVRDAAARGLPFWMALICLPFAFLFGPAGFMMWLGFRAATRFLAEGRTA